MVKFAKNKKTVSRKNPRIYLLVFFILVAAGAVIFRLYSLQVSAHDFYQELATDQHRTYEDLIPKRGEIFVKDAAGHYPVAVNRDLSLVFAVPREIENPREAARQIASVLELDESLLENKLDQPNGWYAVLAHKVGDGKRRDIEEKKIKGIYFSPESQRYYPAGTFASQILGFVGSSGDKVKGRYGIEAYWEQELAGKPGLLEQEKDTQGSWISIGARNIVPAQNGADIYLTIDHTIQYRAEVAIKNSVEKYQADSGTIVILDPHSGAVLSMASWPNFDPNGFSAVEDISVFSNPAVSRPYECGSIFKPFTMAAGLDAKVVTPDATYTDTGEVREAGYTIKNSDLKANGVQTMTQVLEKSLNTGVIHVEKLLGNQRFYDYVKNFGFGSKTEIDTIGEVAGNISGVAALRNINSFTASFGQGISMTPIQLASAFQALANGGKLMKPYLVDKIEENGNGKKTEPRESRQVIAKDASLDITRMLISVVQNGHGKRAGVPGYLVAGKTGTAQIPRQDGPGYEEDAHIGSFAGYAPAYDPRFVMLVRLDQPRNVEWAESSAAPTFGEMAKFMLDYFGVQPTEEFTQKDVDLFNATHDISIYQTPKEEVQPPVQPAPEEEKKEKDKRKKK